MDGLDEMRIVYGRSGKKFAERICEKLRKYPKMGNITVSKTELEVFNDSEIKPKIKENLRRKDVFIVQGFHREPCGVNEDLMELILLNDAVKRASARTITNVLPYMPYSRQEKKIEGRVPISSKKVISILEKDVNRIVTMDLHSPAIQGFSEIPLDNLESKALFSHLIEEDWNKENTVLVSPDLGGASRVEDYSNKLGMERATIRKKRVENNRPEMREIEGIESVEGKDVIIIDDMIDTGGTIKKSHELLDKLEAENIFAFCTHPILSPPASERLSKLDIQVIGSDTIPHTDKFLERNKNWFRVESVDELFAEAIHKIQTGGSISQSRLLFPNSH
ncbi:MAG: ribose-phosphate diphosphokinase [Candidatus Aenigmatarchaeota archaeon]